MAVTVAATMTPPCGSETTPEMLPVIPAQASAAPRRMATINTGIDLNKNRIELSPSRNHSPLRTIKLLRHKNFYLSKARDPSAASGFLTHAKLTIPAFLFDDAANGGLSAPIPL